MVMKLNRILSLGSGVGVTSWILGRLYGAIAPEGVGSAAFTFSTLPLSGVDVNLRQQILSGGNTDFVSQLLSVLGGGEIAIFMGLVMAIIAGIVVVGIGSFALDFIRNNAKFLPTGKTSVGKMVALLFYGSVVGGLISGFIAGQTLAIPAFGVAIAMVIYYFIVAFAYGFIAQNVKALPKPE